MIPHLSRKALEPSIPNLTADILHEMTPLDSIVILGAGNLGRRVARAVKPEVFCDNNPSLWGKFVDGISVESPAAAVRRFPNSTFVVAIWHPSRREGIIDRISQLKGLGAQHAIPFTALLSEYGDQLLPHLLWARPPYYTEHADDIARGRALLDSAGRAEFDRQMRLRMGDHSGQVIDPGAQYFPADLFRLSDSEVFIDCGAYDGDTIAEFRQVSGNQFARIVAFEPDPSNFALLQASVDGDRRISIQPYATGARREMLRFTVTGTGSHISSAGACEVEAVTLDEALSGIAPTYVKFDIEGSEPDALNGARETIARHRPKLAVCVYHAPDHLWSIPRQLHELLPDSRLTLRTYNADGLDCVCYCIPN
jgi:FkbM family methyltransferase